MARRYVGCVPWLVLGLVAGCICAASESSENGRSLEPSANYQPQQKVPSSTQMTEERIKPPDQRSAQGSIIQQVNFRSNVHQPAENHPSPIRTTEEGIKPPVQQSAQDSVIQQVNSRSNIHQPAENYPSSIQNSQESFKIAHQTPAQKTSSNTQQQEGLRPIYFRSAKDLKSPTNRQETTQLINSHPTNNNGAFMQPSENIKSTVPQTGNDRGYVTRQPSHSFQSANPKQTKDNYTNQQSGTPQLARASGYPNPQTKSSYQLASAKQREDLDISFPQSQDDSKSAISRSARSQDFSEGILSLANPQAEKQTETFRNQQYDDGIKLISSQPSKNVEPTVQNDSDGVAASLQSECEQHCSICNAKGKLENGACHCYSENGGEVVCLQKPSNQKFLQLEELQLGPETGDQMEIVGEGEEATRDERCLGMLGSTRGALQNALGQGLRNMTAAERLEEFRKRVDALRSLSILGRRRLAEGGAQPVQVAPTVPGAASTHVAPPVAPAHVVPAAPGTVQPAIVAPTVPKTHLPVSPFLGKAAQDDTLGVAKEAVDPATSALPAENESILGAPAPESGAPPPPVPGAAVNTSPTSGMMPAVPPVIPLPPGALTPGRVPLGAALPRLPPTYPVPGTSNQALNPEIAENNVKEDRVLRSPNEYELSSLIPHIVQNVTKTIASQGYLNSDGPREETSSASPAFKIVDKEINAGEDHSTKKAPQVSEGEHLPTKKPPQVNPFGLAKGILGLVDGDMKSIPEIVHSAGANEQVGSMMGDIVSSPQTSNIFARDTIPADLS